MAFQRRCDRIERGVQQGAGEELEPGWLAPSSSRGDKVSVHSARPPACQPAATTIPLFGNDLLLTPMTRKSTQRVIVEDSRTSCTVPYKARAYILLVPRIILLVAW